MCDAHPVTARLAVHAEVGRHLVGRLPVEVAPRGVVYLTPGQFYSSQCTSRVRGLAPRSPLHRSRAHADGLDGLGVGHPLLEDVERALHHLPIIHVRNPLGRISPRFYPYPHIMTI